MPAQLADKRSKILEAAHARFLHYGISKTTMRDIADALEMSVSNLYLYFENKREIVVAIAETCRDEQEKVFQTIADDTTLKPGQKLEKMLVDKFRFINEFRNSSPHGKELIAYLIQEFPDRPTFWQERLEQAMETFLAQGIHQGAFKIQDTRQAARMLRIATAHFFLPAHIELPLPTSEEELVRLIRWFLKVCETDACC